MPLKERIKKMIHCSLFCFRLQSAFQTIHNTAPHSTLVVPNLISNPQPYVSECLENTFKIIY